MGHFIGSVMNMDQYTEALLHLSVTPQDGLRLENDEVVHDASISLLDALEGCSIYVPTINGQSEITIPPLSKNKDEVVLPDLGPNNGNQKVIININYPMDIERLIAALKPVPETEIAINIEEK
jgi:DnaJ-class molecular chaperone